MRLGFAKDQNHNYHNGHLPIIIAAIAIITSIISNIIPMGRLWEACGHSVGILCDSYGIPTGVIYVHFFVKLFMSLFYLPSLS